jgi:hypothetical protein
MQHWQRDFKDASAGRGSIHMAKNNMWWKRSISSTKALRSWWLIMFATILQQRPRLPAVAQTFAEQGLPSSITLDRDPRWVGSPPSAVTSPLLSCASATPRASPCSSAIPITPTKWLCRTTSQRCHPSASGLLSSILIQSSSRGPFAPFPTLCRGHCSRALSWARSSTRTRLPETSTCSWHETANVYACRLVSSAVRKGRLRATRPYHP